MSEKKKRTPAQILADLERKLKERKDKKEIKEKIKKAREELKKERSKK